MYCKHTVDGRNPAPPGCIKPCKQCDIYHINWCRISFINSIVLYSIHNYIPRLSANSPLHPRNRRHTPPEKLTMKLLTVLFPHVLHPNKSNQSIWWDHPQRYHTISSVVSSNWTSSNWTSSNFKSSPVTVHSQLLKKSSPTIKWLNSPIKHLRDEFVVKKQVVSTPATSRGHGRAVFCVHLCWGLKGNYIPRIGVCSKSLLVGS